MSSFAKLDSGILDSSLWSSPNHVRLVWITILAKKDHKGILHIAPSALRRLVNLSDDPDGIKFIEAVNVLESPDPESRTLDFEGRRIKKIEGGWKVLNHDKYRKYSYSDDPAAIRQRAYRKTNSVTSRDMSQLSQNTHNVSVSVSESVSLSLEEEYEKEFQIFDTFVLMFPGQRLSSPTEMLNFKRTHVNYKEYLPKLIPAIKNQINWRLQQAKIKPPVFIPAWKSLKNWQEQKCWEEEKPSVLNNTPTSSLPKENEAIKKLREAEKHLPTKEEMEEFIDLMKNTAEWKYMTPEQQNEQISKMTKV